jgi:hypothetical protein
LIIGWDLAPRKCGWCAGDGASVPLAGGFRLPGIGDNIGQLLDELKQQVDVIHNRFDPDVVMFESPILPSGHGPAVMGSLDQRRVQMSQSAFLEWLVLDRARRLGRHIICEEADVYEVKYALTGRKRPGKTSQEQKDAMVAAALKIGVSLPIHKIDGREDAADAVGAWLVGVRYHAKKYLPEWDRRVWSPKGALL